MSDSSWDTFEFASVLEKPQWSLETNSHNKQFFCATRSQGLDLANEVSWAFCALWVRGFWRVDEQMLTLHLEAGKFIQMAEIPFWTKMVQYQFRQYHFSALKSLSSRFALHGLRALDFCPGFCSEFLSEFSPKFLRSFRASFRGKRRPQKNLTKNPHHFSKQNSQADTKKIFTKVFWRGGKVRMAFFSLRERFSWNWGGPQASERCP